MNLVHPGRWFAALIMIAAASAAFAVAPLVNASIEPAQIALGETAELTITSSGIGMDPVSLPEVAGLEFRVVGQTRRVEIIKGAMLATNSILIRVTPHTAGIFTIPGITPKSQPLVLRVNPEGTPSSSSPAARAPSANGVRLSADGSAYVRLVLPKHEIYVGESTPVEIEVGMRNGFVASLNGLPTLTGGEFTLNNLSHQPERTEKLIDGKPFTLLTWHSILAPVKSGSYSVSVETPLTVKIRTRPQRESMLDDMLGDPFLQNFFGTTVPKDITVTSSPTPLTVLSLPTEGRPAGFSGAVGSFKIAGDLSSHAAAAGDPLTLRMHVTGSGNFDRVDTAMLAHVDRWKTYPPTSSFKAGDAVGFKGEKTFEQPLIAAQPGAQTLPGLSFSYFDPASRRYETVHTPPQEVTIAPSLADSSQHSPQAVPGSAAPPPPNPIAVPATDGLRPDHALSDIRVRTLTPLYLQPRFLALPSALTLAFAGAWLLLRRRPAALEASAAHGRSTSKAVERIMADMNGAARAGDSAAFFDHARRALNAEARGGGDKSAASTEADGGTDPVGDLLALADEARYAGLRPTTADFDRWTHFVRHRLEAASPS